MSGRPSSSAIRNARRAQVVRLRQGGMRTADIARQLAVSEVTILRDLDRLGNNEVPDEVSDLDLPTHVRGMDGRLYPTRVIRGSLSDGEADLINAVTGLFHPDHIKNFTLPATKHFIRRLESALEDLKAHQKDIQ